AWGGCWVQPLPLVTIGDVVAEKVGHDIEEKELEGLAQLLGPGPLMGRQHEPAEASRFCLNALDLRDGIIRGTDDPVATVGARARRNLLRRLARIRLIGRLQSDGKEIFHVAADGFFNIGPSLLPTLSEVHAGGNAPVVAGGPYAVFGGRRLHGAPLFGGSAVFSGGRQKQHAVFAGELRANRISRRSDSEGHARLLVRAQL